MRFDTAQRITLEQFLRGDDAEWQPYDFNQNVLKQEAAYASAQSNENPPFTIVEARKAYQRLKEKSTGAVERRSPPSNNPALKVGDRPIDGAKAGGEEKESVTGKLALIAALLLLGIAMFRVFSRRGKRG